MKTLDRLRDVDATRRALYEANEAIARAQVARADPTPTAEEVETVRANEARLLDVEAERRTLELQRDRLIEGARPITDDPLAFIRTGASGTIGEAVQRDPAFRALISGESGTPFARIVVKGMSLGIRHRAANTMHGSPQFSAQPIDVGVYSAAKRAPRIRDLIPVYPLTGPSVAFARETGVEGAAAIVPEGAVKPFAHIQTTPIITPAVMVAVLSSVTNQCLADSAYLIDWLNFRLSELVLDREDSYLLDDPTVGMMTLATPFAPTGTPAAWQAIGGALAALAATGDAPAATVLNPADAGAIAVAADTEGRPIIPGLPTQAPSGGLFGVPVAVTPAMPAGQFLVIGKSAAALYDRMALTIDVNPWSSEYWTTNSTGVRCEERITLAVYRPASLLKGAIPVVPPAARSAPQDTRTAPAARA